MPNPPKVDMTRWGDRCVASGQLEPAAKPPELGPRDLKPIVVRVSADEIARMYTAQHGNCNPNVFNQFLLERFKYFGAPVEGTIVYKLAHGAIAKVKMDPTKEHSHVSYIWLPAEYAVAIAHGAANTVQ